MKPKKLTRKQFIELAKKGPVQIEENLSYVVVKVNSDNIKMNDLFKSQLIDENKYDKTYIGFFAYNTEQKPYSMENLAIYGDPNKYVTKHLRFSLEDAVMDDLRRREIGLLKRHHEYQLSIVGGEQVE